MIKPNTIAGLTPTGGGVVRKLVAKDRAQQKRNLKKLSVGSGVRIKKLTQI